VAEPTGPALRIEVARLLVDRRIEMHGSPDPDRAQLAEQLGAIGLEHEQREHLPDVRAAVRDAGQLDALEAAEPLEIALRHPPATGVELVEALHLLDAERREQLAHPEVVAGERRGPKPRPLRLLPLQRRGFDAVPDQRTRLPVQLRVVGGEQPAFARRDVLRGEEREAALSEAALRAPAVRGPDRLRRVLDQGEPVALTRLRDRLHVRHLAGVVHDHHGLGGRPDRGRDRLGVGTPRVRIDVDQHRRRARRHDGIGRRHEREGRYDHLASNAARLDRQLERRGAGVHGDGIRRARELLELLLELAVLGTVREPAGAQHLEHGLALGRTELRPAERDFTMGGRLHHFRS
jgi:hypothetical protein